MTPARPTPRQLEILRALTAGAYVLEHPETRRAYLHDHDRPGERMNRRALERMKKAGWLQRVQFRNGAGYWTETAAGRAILRTQCAPKETECP